MQLSESWIAKKRDKGKKPELTILLTEYLANTDSHTNQVIPLIIVKYTIAKISLAKVPHQHMDGNNCLCHALVLRAIQTMLPKVS